MACSRRVLARNITTIDVQSRFKVWYNHRYPHRCQLSPSVDDHVTCTCSHRPVKNLSTTSGHCRRRLLICSMNSSIRRGRRAIGVVALESKDVRRYSIMNRKENESRELISYAVNDCLAVTKLFTTMQAD